MPLKEHVEKTVQTGFSVHKQELGVIAKVKAGQTVKLPAHVAKFFEDKGLVA